MWKIINFIKQRNNKEKTPFVKVFTHHEIIYRIPICAHNGNCGFMRTYIPCYKGSEKKVSLTKNTAE